MGFMDRFKDAAQQARRAAKNVSEPDDRNSMLLGG